MNFPIASVTKTFTAALCLEADVRDNLDVPFREVLPGFSLSNPEAARRMTPRDALCHFSGLEPHTAAWVENPLSRREFMIRCLPGMEVAADWRSRHRYSNLMYAVLGVWLETLTGQSWEALIDSRIKAPLDLKSLHHLEPGWESACPPPLAFDGDTCKRIAPFFSKKHHLIAPASELRMSVRDMARWGQHHLSLPPDDERWRPHSVVSDTRPFPEFGPLHYGLGWRLDTVNGRRRVWHTGQCSGYTTLLSLYPEDGKGLAAATNCSASTEMLHGLDLEFLHRNQTL
jgi:CubicO group peptidase (beta-lactamase class C family)